MTELVQRLNDLTPYWADAMWRALWQGGLAIVIVWVLCSILPKVPARMRCWLWRLAFAKLLVCLFWAAPIRIALLPAAKLPASVDQNVAQGQPPAGSPTRVQSTQSVTNHEYPRNTIKPGILTWALIFWASGVIAGLAGTARQWWLARLLIRNSRELDHEQIRTDLILLSRNFGVRSLPEVRVADGLGTPLLAGFRYPAILVPQSFLKTKSPEQLRMMLAHELAHIKRRDLWWAWLGIATRVLLFFHPLVWLAKKESRIAEEMAADELTVTVCNLKPVDYAGMLLEVSASRFPTQKVELVVGVFGSHKTLKRRLQAMKYISSISSRQMITAAVVIIIVGAGVIVPWRITAKEPTKALPGATSNQTSHDMRATEMKRYKSEEWNFAIDVPKRWNAFPPVSSNSPYEVIRFLSHEDGTNTLIIFRIPYDPAVSLRKFVEGPRKILADAGFENFVFGEATIGSRPVVTLDFDKPKDGGTWSCREYYIADGTLVYSLGFGTSNKDAMFDLFNRMAKSFEITAEP